MKYAVLPPHGDQTYGRMAWSAVSVGVAADMFLIKL